MFEDFLYLLRRNGLKVSMTEWMALEEGLYKGLHHCTLTGFYHLCRTVMIKSEADFDQFDHCFLAYFKDVPFQQEVSQEMLNWLDRPNSPMADYDELQAQLNQSLSHTEIEIMFQQRQGEQREAHNCGTHWVGTHGMSVFGNDGLSPNGIRVGGGGGGRRAFRVAGERRFRDFRRDNALDERQFQVALRHLRQFSGLIDQPPTQFDVDRTIRDTADSAGMLKVRYKRPRENTVKVLLLMDSGGSMDYHAQLCSGLFHAVSKSSHFKDLKTYYFHNCIYTRLYQDPVIDPRRAVPTQWVLDNIPPDYKVIFVGDAQMEPDELLGTLPVAKSDGPQCGMDYLRQFKQRYGHAVWLNPSDRPDWGAEWSKSYDTIAREFPMYPLTVDGLTQAMKKLLSR